MQIATGKIQRVSAFRLKPGEDVLEGLKKACELSKINNGVIVSAIGSLKNVTFSNPIELPQKKAGYGYGDPLVLNEPIELLSASGMICNGQNGETLFHVHVCLSDKKGHAYGGHLLSPTKVLLTVDMVIAEIEEIKMGREFDEELEVFLFKPTQK
jgi:predicted DNA-binding protein with PD1-like motif